MNKILSILAISLLFFVGCNDDSPTSPTPAPEYSVTVLYPNGGEVLRRGAFVEIRWQSTNVESVNIYLVKLDAPTNGSPWQLAYSAPSQAGLYVWLNPQHTTGAYKIVISDSRGYSNRLVEDQSDGAFYFE